MRLLRLTDGTDPHLRALRYHAQQCRRKKSVPPFQALMDKAVERHKDLKEKAREVEDAEEKATDCTADVDNAELGLEGEIRDLHSAVATFDRNNPQHGAYAKIFPQGLEGVIGPERQKQVAPVVALQERIAPFLSHPPIQEANDKLSAALQAFKDALGAKSAQDEVLQTLFNQEVQLRGAGREQLTDAQGQITSFFKGNPALVEAFFIEDPRKGSTARARAEERGRITGKLEALSHFLKKRQIITTPEQEERLSAALEEARVDQALDLAYGGAGLELILAALAPATA
jgi:hypothetical protein